MPLRPKKRDDTVAKRVLEQLEKLREITTNPSEPPSSSEVMFKAAAPDTEPESTLIFEKMTEMDVNPVPPAAYLRLRNWLALAEYEKLPGAYGAILQTWLKAHGIGWPRGVFSQDLVRSGTGMHRESEGDRIIELRRKGWTDDQIAARQYKTLYAQSPAKAKRK